MAVNIVDEINFNAVQYNGPRPSFSEFQQASKRYLYTKTIPPGKMSLQKLADNVLSVSTDVKYLYLQSDIEGVEWWSIDSSTPSVDEDVESFGWILDLDWPEYVHDHGLPFGTADGVDHTGTNPGGAPYPAVMRLGTRKFYDVLPTFVSTSAVRQSPFICPGGLYQGANYSEALSNVGSVTDGVKSLNLRADNSASLLTGARSVNWLFGKESYRNFGTSSDGLCFFVVLYVQDVSQLTPNPQKANLFFYSYPFTSTTYKDLSSLPDNAYVTNGGTVGLYSNQDIMLDHALNAPPGIVGQISSGGSLGVTSGGIPYTIVNGYQVFMANKSNFVSLASIAASVGVSENPPWNRITAGDFNINVKPGGILNARLINIFFGPQPGRRRVLRPFEYTTEKPWSSGSIPSIGLYNPHTVDAHVKIIYGAN